MSPIGRYFLEHVDFAANGFVKLAPSVPYWAKYIEYTEHVGKLLTMSVRP